MPLTHETDLRITLDALFYENTIVAKLKGIDRPKLNEYFKPTEGQTEADYLKEILDFIGNNFVGYSIYHVDVRFRAADILDFNRIAVRSKKGARYLIDETTAVTRFIFPWDSDEQLQTIRFLFEQLFVRGMIDLVEGEQQIWMLENGTERLVHIWRAPDDSAADVEATADEAEAADVEKDAEVDEEDDL